MPKRKNQSTFGEAICDLGFRQAAAILGRRGGLANKGRTSEAKAITARENGKKGGRPKKKPQAQRI